MEIHTIFIWEHKARMYSSLIVSFSFDGVTSTNPDQSMQFIYIYYEVLVKRNTFPYISFPDIYFTCPTHGPHPRHTS